MTKLDRFTKSTQQLDPADLLAEIEAEEQTPVPSVFDPRHPLPSIAHALEYYPCLPLVVTVPKAPTPMLAVNGAHIAIKEDPKALGVICQGEQPTDSDAKGLLLVKLRRGEL